MKNKKIGFDLTEGNVSKKLIILVLPMLLGNFLNVFYNIVDGIWIGQIVGHTGLAAIAVSFPILLVLIAFASGVTVASNILVGQFFGAGDEKSLVHVSRVSSTISGVIALLLATLGYIFAPALIHLLKAPDNVRVMAVDYFRISMIGFPFLFYYFLVASLLRGIGDTVRPLIFLTITSIVNIVLDPMMIKGIYPFPKMGLNGAAYATVISQILSVIISVAYLKLKNSVIRVNPFRCVFDVKILKMMFNIGLPFASMQFIVSISWMFLTRIINSYGDFASASVAVVSRVDSLTFMPLMALSAGLATMSAQNIGANKMGRLKEIYKSGLKIGVGISAVVAIIAVIFPELIIRIFTKEDSVMLYAKSYIYIMMPSLVMLAVMFATNGIVNGAGKTFVLMLCSFVSLILVRVPLAYLFSSMFGVIGVWWAMSVACLVSMILSLAYYFSKRWMKGARIEEIHGRENE